MVTSRTGAETVCDRVSHAQEPRVEKVMFSPKLGPQLARLAQSASKVVTFAGPGCAMVQTVGLS
jgi:hypothetical protein